MWSMDVVVAIASEICAENGSDITTKSPLWASRKRAYYLFIVKGGDRGEEARPA